MTFPGIVLTIFFSIVIVVDMIYAIWFISSEIIRWWKKRKGAQMSKAMLMLDEIPESCSECRLKVFVDDEYIGANICAGMPEHNEISDYGEMSREPWCPLKEMPERREALADDSWQNGYKFGWNGCLKAIGGGDER